LKEKLSWSFKTFDELNIEELYDLLRLRTEVFVIGQQCVYQDMDGWDKRAIHVCGRLNNELVAYCRIFPPDIVEQGYGNFGRVAVDKAMRGKAFGRQLMQETIGYMQQYWPENGILIHAQHYLKAFYESLGFRQCTELYDEVGIPHIHMLMDKPQ